MTCAFKNPHSEVGVPRKSAGTGGKGFKNPAVPKGSTMNPGGFKNPTQASPPKTATGKTFSQGTVKAGADLVTESVLSTKPKKMGRNGAQYPLSKQPVSLTEKTVDSGIQ